MKLRMEIEAELHLVEYTMLFLVRKLEAKVLRLVGS